MGLLRSLKDLKVCSNPRPFVGAVRVHLSYVCDLFEESSANYSSFSVGSYQPIYMYFLGRAIFSGTANVHSVVTFVEALHITASPQIAEVARHDMIAKGSLSTHDSQY